MNDLVQYVKDYAAVNYEVGGWDYIVEALTDEDVARILENEKVATREDAIRVVGEYAGTLDSHRRDIEATAF